MAGRLRGGRKTVFRMDAGALTEDPDGSAYGKSKMFAGTRPHRGTRPHGSQAFLLKSTATAAITAMATMTAATAAIDTPPSDPPSSASATSVEIM